jgi:hypothetical protein
MAVHVYLDGETAADHAGPTHVFMASCLTNYAQGQNFTLTFPKWESSDLKYRKGYILYNRITLPATLLS